MLLNYKPIVFLIILLLLQSCDRSSVSEPVDDGLPPAQPSNLSVYYARDGEIGIEWRRNNEPDLMGYNIYRSVDETDEFTLLDFTTNEYYIDSPLEYDLTYSYKISAVDIASRESNLSQIVSATPENFYAPLSPASPIINARNWNDSLSIKLSWSPPVDNDLAGYEIHRGDSSGFTPTENNFIGFSSTLSFTDKSNLELLKNYFYIIISVDKGDLKSNPSSEFSDMIFDRPVIISPANGADINYNSEFKIKTVGAEASYKLVIQANELVGIIEESNISSDIVNGEIEIPVNTNSLDPYNTYYWRVYSYSVNDNSPNSFTDLYNFTIYPE